MKWKWHMPAVALLVASVGAIFSDDAFNIDYHQALLGIPQSHTTFFHKPQSSSNASLLYTISDKTVLGAVNPRDGSLVWRQALAGEPTETPIETFLVAGDADGRITSGFQSSVKSWDALDGRLDWSYDFGPGLLVKGIQTVPNIAEAAQNVIQDIVAIVGPGKDSSGAKVVRLAGDGTAARWEYQDKSASRDTAYSVATSPKYVYYITKSSGLISGGKARVVVIDITNGKEVSQYSVAVDSEGLANDGALSFGSGSEAAFLLSSEKPYKALKLNILGSSKSINVALEDKGEEIEKIKVLHVSGPYVSPHFLVHAQGKTKHWAEIFHINAKKGDVSRAYSLPATAEISTFAASSVGHAVYFTRITDGEVSLYSSESHGHIGRWPRSGLQPKKSSSSLHAITEVSTRGGATAAVRVALSSNEAGWSLIRNGDTSWLRPEILAYINKAVWSDDIQVELSAHDIEAEAASNPMSAYVYRVTRHIQALKHLPQYLIGLPQSLLQSGDDAEKSVRERLVGTKLILASTSRGEVLALDAATAGTIRWITKISEVQEPMSKAVHLSVDGDRLTVYLADGQFVVLNIADGQILERQKSSSPFYNVLELPGQPASTIVRVSSAGIPEVFSELAPAVPTEGNVLVTINDKGEAVGWSVGSDVEKIWTLQPGPGTKINQVVARPPHDPVASIGLVLGDRSVLYKYINPNIALLTAFSSTTLTVYIINAVTGAVLHTASHEGVLAELPVSAAASGNKFAYTFTNRDASTSGLSSQVVVSELYESENPNDRGLLLSKANYSSFSPDAGARPFVLSQAFTVAEPLSNLAVSQTTQGITSRQLFAYLAGSRSIVGIPTDILNARRPVDRDPSSPEQEEGLFRYNPILELDPKLFLSHTREIFGVKHVLTSPTLLESTSLLFAFGHDIFGTQVAPSDTFDVLGKSFKRIQLVLTVVALYAGVLAIRPIARRKMVERRWL